MIVSMHEGLRDRVPRCAIRATDVVDAAVPGIPLGISPGISPGTSPGIPPGVGGLPIS